MKLTDLVLILSLTACNQPKPIESPTPEPCWPCQDYSSQLELKTGYIATQCTTHNQEGIKGTVTQQEVRTNPYTEETEYVMTYSHPYTLIRMTNHHPTENVPQLILHPGTNTPELGGPVNIGWAFQDTQTGTHKHEHALFIKENQEGQIDQGDRFYRKP